MEVTSYWALLTVLFGLLTVLATTSGLINANLWISEPLACALVGFAIGPMGFGVVFYGHHEAPLNLAFLHQTARFTLALAVTGAAMRLPAGWLRRNWRGMLVVLGPGMLLMAAASTCVAVITLGVPLLTAALIGCSLTPTDPVLSAPLVTGRLAERAVPGELRHGITAESGANDGLAYPLVFLPLIFLHGQGSITGLTWVIRVVVLGVGGAIAVGAAAGWVACQVLRWAASRPDASHSSLLTAAIALSLASLTGVHWFGGDGIMASFAAGAVLNGCVLGEAEQRQERFNEAMTRFFDLPGILLFGAMLPWHAWMQLSWRGLAFALVLLGLRRLPAWLLLHRWMPWARNRRYGLFAGWFGPTGAGAVFYVLDLQARTGRHDLWPAVSLAVAASVVAHGVSGTPLTRMFGQIGFRQPLKTDAK